jgi:ABC-type amino acid transport substrate-binding protein
MLKFILAALTALLLATPPAGAQTADDVNASIETVLGDPAAYAEAFEAIQAAVADDDAEAVAEWISYPLSVTIDGEAQSIEGPEAFVEQYGGIVTDEIKSAVVEQKYEDLFVNAEGVMFGNGQMWLSGVCRDDACTESDVRIITIQSTAD